MSSIDSCLEATLRGCEFSGPVSLVKIEAAEKALGLSFPPSYRRFLAQYGAALGNGFWIAGLPAENIDPNEPPLWSNVVRDTMMYRPASLPQDSIAITHDGSELGYFLRRSKSDPEYEGPVIEWAPPHDGGKECSGDFLSFFESWSAANKVR